MDLSNPNPAVFRYANWAVNVSRLEWIHVSSMDGPQSGWSRVRMLMFGRPHDDHHDINLPDEEATRLLTAYEQYWSGR